MRDVRRYGFTLVELMVAMMVAAMLMGIIYTVYISAAKAYRVQNMALEMQGQVRFGLDHVRRDLSNAGFNATPNSQIDSNLCVAPASKLQAVRVALTPNSVFLPNLNTNIQPMEFTLLGDYAGTGDVFTTVSIVGSTVTIQGGFKNTITQAMFDTMFLPGGQRRMLRIVDKDQYEMIIPVQSANYGGATPTAPATIELAATPPSRGPSQQCGIQGFGEGLDVNPLNFIRYRVVKDTRPSAPPNGSKYDLIREEMSTDGVTAITGTQLVIVENVVELAAYDFVFDDDVTGLQPVFSFVPDNTGGVLVNSGGQGLLGTDSVRVQDLRFLTLKLTVRTADEDEGFVFQKRASATAAIVSYDADKTLVGSARTMTLTSKIFMRTLAVRNIKPGSP